MATDLDIYEGNDKTWTVAITDSTGTPIDITGYVFVFTIKSKASDSDSDAIVKKLITEHISPTEGLTQITLKGSETIGKHGKYIYDYQWLDTANKKRVVLKKALFEIEQSVPDAFD